MRILPSHGEGAEMIATGFHAEPLPYTGRELRPHFLLTKLGLKGAALGAFIGPCRVETEELVDWEDRLVNDHIEARSMVHFLGEFFGMGLREGVVLQRLLMAIMAETLNERRREWTSDSRLPTNGLSGRASDSGLVLRRGDDLFFRERKLSVSIVTASPVSILLHAGVNIDPEGAPVPAVGLPEVGCPEARPWAEEVLERFRAEAAEMDWACAKVRPVV
jgi:hypothetical protein